MEKSSLVFCFSKKCFSILETKQNLNYLNGWRLLNIKNWLPQNKVFFSHYSITTVSKDFFLLENNSLLPYSSWKQMFLQGYSWVNYVNIFYFSTTSIHYSLSANGNNLYSLMILSKYLIFHYDFNFFILLHSLSCSLKLLSALCTLFTATQLHHTWGILWCT